MAKSKASFQWNYDEQTIIARKGFGRNLNRDFAKILVSHMDKYVPYDPHRQMGVHMADDIEYKNMNDNYNSVGIVYNAPYANKQYNNTNPHQISSHSPLATDHWDKYCWELEKDEIIAEVDAARMRYTK